MASARAAGRSSNALTGRSGANRCSTRGYILAGGSHDRISVRHHRHHERDHGSARVEIELGSDAPRLAYRVTRQPGSDRYVIRDPFGAAIDGVASLERAVEIATGLAENVRDWASETFDC